MPRNDGHEWRGICIQCGAPLTSPPGPGRKPETCRPDSGRPCQELRRLEQKWVRRAQEVLAASSTRGEAGSISARERARRRLARGLRTLAEELYEPR